MSSCLGTHFKGVPISLPSPAPPVWQSVATVLAMAASLSALLLHVCIQVLRGDKNLRKNLKFQNAVSLLPSLVEDSGIVEEGSNCNAPNLLS